MSKISIIIPSFNKEKYISETIESVLNQTHNNWELLIVDDCSTDNSVKIISTYLSDNRIKLIANEQNKGASYCRNFGLKEANGKYLIFLDADDILIPSCLENRIAIIEKMEVDFCVFSMGVFNKEIGDNNFKWVPKSKNPLSDFLEHKLAWSILQPIWKKELLESINGFDIEFDRLQDVEFHTRILFIEGVKFEYVNSITDCYYRIDEGRKNFNRFDFLKRSVSSAVKYYTKFYPLAAKIKLENKLIGTLYKMYSQVLYAYKLKNINKNQFVLFENELINTYKNNNSFFINACFFTGKFFNWLPFRIKGINWLVNKLLTI